MNLDTQIRTFQIPASWWSDGHPRRPDLPPLKLPARDALAIERRATKRVNPHRESHRHLLCLELMQGIVQELATDPTSPLPPPMVWSSTVPEGAAISSADAFLWVGGALRQWRPWQNEVNQHKVYERVPRGFFPPDHADEHLTAIEWIAARSDIQELFRLARPPSVLREVSTLPAIEAAFHQRFQIVKQAKEKGVGLVDVIELVLT